MIAWLTLVVALVVLVGLIWAALRFAGGRRIGQQRSEVYEELAAVGQRLGLANFSERAYFQARVASLSGQINGYGVECELWDHSQDSTTRLTFRFPRPLRQGLRMARTDQGGLFKWLHRMQEIELGVPEFDAHFGLLARENDEQILEFLNSDVREKLLSLSSTTTDLRLGDHALFVSVRRFCEGQDFERLLRSSLRVAVAVFNSSAAVGPSASTKSASYSKVQSQMFSRTGDESGTDTMVGGPHRDDYESESGASRPESSWAPSPTGSSGSSTS